MKEKETYTVKEAMVRLGVKSLTRLLRLERKHPQAFIVVKQTKGLKQKKGKIIHYDKATLDRFAKTREHLNQEQL
jgi:hypothetical protein